MIDGPNLAQVKKNFHRPNTTLVFLLHTGRETTLPMRGVEAENSAATAIHMNVQILSSTAMHGNPDPLHVQAVYI